MKINEIIEEGFWDSVKKGAKAVANVAGITGTHGGRFQGVGTGIAAGLAKGFGAHTASQALVDKAKASAAQTKQAQAAAQAAIEKQAGAVMRPHPGRASIQPGQPGVDPNALQPGERFEIIEPNTKSKYYKTNTGWFNQVGQKVTASDTINYLENTALQQRGKFIPTPKQRPKLSPKQQRRADAEAARKAAYEPAMMTKPVVYNKPRPQVAEGTIPNKNTDIYSGYSEWKQAVAGMSAGFAKYKRDKDDNQIARYNGKIIGTWNEEEGTGYVYNKVDTGPTPIVKEATLTEGGNVFPDVKPIKQEYVRGIINDIRKIVPKGVDIIPDIGSAGYKVESGDMDVFVDAGELAKLFNTPDEKYTRLALKQYVEKQGFEAAQSGRNVHVKMPVPDGSFVQVDLMIIPDAAKVAPFHTHGPSGQYKDPGFKGGQLFILYASIAKALGLKFSPFEGKLVDRTTNKVIADNKDSVAKILLNPGATADDLANINTIMKALAADPQKNAKLAQAKEDEKKGLIKLPESKQPGSSSWFRTLSEIVR